MPSSQLLANHCIAHVVESNPASHSIVAIAVAVAVAMTKRKSRGPDLDRQEPPTGLFPKRAKTGAQPHPVAAPVKGSPAVDHALLKQYYSQTTTLRDHVLASLPAASRLRRRKIASVGRTPPSSSPAKACTEAEMALARLLDTTLVASRGPLGSEIVDESKTIPDLRWEQWIRFSQRGADESYVTLADGLGGSLYSQAEVRRKPLVARSGLEEPLTNKPLKDCRLCHLAFVFPRKAGNLAQASSL